MDLDLEWQKGAVERLLREEEPKEEKEYLSRLYSHNDKISESKKKPGFYKNFKRKKNKYKIFYNLF